MPGYFLPSRLAGLTELTAKGKLIGGDQLAALLKTSAKPVFPEGAPTWYPEFSRSVYTNLHAAAAGSMSVDDAIKAIVDTTRQAGERIVTSLRPTVRAARAPRRRRRGRPPAVRARRPRSPCSSWRWPWCRRA